MPLPYRTILRLPAEADAVSIAEQEAERWLLAKSSPEFREKIRSGTVFENGVHSLGTGKTLTVVRTDAAADGSRRVRLRLLESNREGQWEASITALDYPSGNRRRDALVITASRVDQGTGEWEAAPPRFVKELLARENVYDGAAHVTAAPQRATSDDVPDVLSAITDRACSVSVIVAASLGAAYDDELRTRVARLTSNVIGVAAVYVITTDAIEPLNERLGTSHGLEPGRIRTFLPLVDLDDPADGRRHRVLGPTTFANAIRGDDVADYLKSAFARETRSALLSRPLPSDIRRGIDALDSEMRKLLQEERIENRVRDRLPDSVPARPTPELEGAVPAEPQSPAPTTDSTTPHASPAAETFLVHGIMKKLQRLAAKWLKNGDPVSESTVDELELHIVQQEATIEDWLETASGLEEELSAARDASDEMVAEQERLETDLAIVEEDAASLRSTVSFLRSQLVKAKMYDEAHADPSPDPEWTVPQSLVELANLLRAKSERQHPAFAHLEFTGDIDEVASLQKRDPIGRYASAFWEFVHTLYDYAELKKIGTFTGGVHQYLNSAEPGYKCSPQRHAARESDSVANNEAWRAQRVLPVPVSAHLEGHVFMQAHFKPTHSDTVAPRMHYYDDTDRGGKIYIGYIGRHLENTKTKNS